MTTDTLQFTLLPPPVTMPLHWSTEVTSWFDEVTVVVQPKGGRTPAAAKHAVAVTVDETAPAAVTVLAMAMVQFTSKPAPVGKAGGAHWVAAGAVAAAEAAGTPARPPMRTRVDRAVTTPTIPIRQRRSTDEAANIKSSLKNPEINTAPCGRSGRRVKLYTRNK